MRLTARGKACTLVVLGLWISSLVLHSAWAALAACVITCYLLVYLAALSVPPLDVAREFERRQIVEDESVTETIRVTNLGRHHRRILLREARPPGMEPDVGAEVPLTLDPQATAETRIVWRSRTWGPKRWPSVEVVSTDPLHMLESLRTLPDEKAVRVLPRSRSLKKFTAPASNPEPALGNHNVSKPGDGAEFFTLREYQPGDNIRRINWKASARSPRTMVNQVTRDTYARVVVILDMREKEEVGAHESSPHVRNVRAVAQVLASHDRLRDHTIILRVTDQAERISLGTNPRLVEQLEALAESKPSGAMSMEAAVRKALPLIHPRSPVYVVTSGALDPDMGAALRLVQAARATPIVIAPTLPPLEEGAAVFAKTRALALGGARAAGARVHEWSENHPLEVALRAA